MINWNTPEFNPIDGAFDCRVLIACEYSGIVRRAFEAREFDVWSCDLLPAEDGSNRHMQCDVREVLADGWDLVIVAHPPCTRLCNSGVRWLHKPPEGRTLDDIWLELHQGADLFSECWNAPAPRVAVENPVMHKHAKRLIRNYQDFSQSVQPWQFGDAESKRTCLWTRGLPDLVPTHTKDDYPAGTEFIQRVHKMPPSADRGKERSRFFEGIAAAMADQWGSVAAQAAAQAA